MVKIAILDDWQGVARSSADWSRLAARGDLVFFADAFGSEDEAALTLADFDILLTMRERTPFPEALIRRLRKLRMIGITGASNASLDVEACTRQGVTVCNTTAGAGAPYATAELALGLMIAAARAIPTADGAMRAGGFQRDVPVGIGLAGKTLGIVGLGRLGARLARYALALDMKVAAWSSEPNRSEGAGGGRPPRWQIRPHDRFRCHLRAHGSVASHPWPHRRRGHRAHETKRHPDQHLTRAPRRRSRSRRRRSGRQDHCSARRLRQRAATEGPSIPGFRPYRAHAPSRVRSG